MYLILYMFGDILYEVKLLIESLRDYLLFALFRFSLFIADVVMDKLCRIDKALCCCL